MEAQKLPPPMDGFQQKSKSKKKKKTLGQSQPPGDTSARKGQKPPKRSSPMNGVSPLLQQRQLTPDSQQDSSAFANEYRTLRRKYLLLEEESFALGGELQGVEDEVKVLEDEKTSLLDELVVLEGLVDPSEVRHNADKGCHDL